MWLPPVDPFDVIFPSQGASPVCGARGPTCPNGPIFVGKSVPYCAQARQDLELEKQRVVTLGTGADSVKMEGVSSSGIGDTLAKEDRLMAGAFEILY